MRLLVNFLFSLCTKSRLCQIKNQTFPSFGSRYVTAFTTMTTNSNCTVEPLSTFQGQIDRFNGVTVNSEYELCDIQTFEGKVDKSIQKWREEGRRGIWFKVHLDQSDWVPVLAKKGFHYHHAKDNFVMMYLWLPLNENCNIPQFAHTMIGVGAVVVNEKSQVLVVSEKYYNVPHWKLPGGYVEPGENLVDAAIREVLEETGIQTEFLSLLTLRQTHYGMFGCSDIYTVVSLKPLTFNIESCEREIMKSEWMDIDEYLDHPHVHELNRFFVQKYLEYLRRDLKIDCHHGIHQVLKKAYTVYYIAKEEQKGDTECKM